MAEIEIPEFIAFTLSIVLLFVGKGALARSTALRRYSIPEPVVGGFLCVATVAALYLAFDVQVTFELESRDTLLVYFFSGIGMRSDLATLRAGGRPLAILTFLAALFIVLQNLVGMSVAQVFGLDAKAGLMAGSVSLTGGVGTALAWAPIFVRDLGIENALEIAVASNTVGLISACCVGGPIAAFLIRRHDLRSKTTEDLDVGISRDSDESVVDAYGILWAWMWLNVSILLGWMLDQGLQALGLTFPLFVSCLVAGIFVSNAVMAVFPGLRWPTGEQGVSVISDVSLGTFLTMALMGLRVWELTGALLFLAVVMGIQILLSVAFTVFVVFRTMGRDYEAAVMSAGFGGITLGSTATAIVNMTAVAKEHGAAHRAFIVVPLVCGFFVDLINAITINLFVNF